MKSNARIALVLAGIGSSLIALLHIIIIVIGESAYQYFQGVGDEFAQMLNNGSILPTIITAIITLVFIIFALYAFSGSGIILRLPYLQIILIAIGTIFILRGIMNIPFYAYVIVKHFEITECKSFAFDLISLLIGILYIIGVRNNPIIFRKA